MLFGTNDRLKRALGILGAAALGAQIIGGCALQANSADGDVARPAWQRDFAAMNPMIKMATAYGDRGKGAHGSFGQFAPNFITPMHTHTGAYHGIVISGVMTNPFEGEGDPPKMGPGSYWHVPANSVHATACVSDTPCEFYFYADSAFDFNPTQ